MQQGTGLGSGLAGPGRERVNMKFGVCADVSQAPILTVAGFDFLELNVQANLKPEAEEADFLPELARIRGCPLPCTAANCFLPGHLKPLGPDVPKEPLKRYVETACERARRAGIQTIVFGSGGARQIPEGFDRSAAWKQLLDFGWMASTIAHKHGVTIAVEPLNRNECNVFNTLGECNRFVRDLNLPNLRLLLDSYHWSVEKDSVADILDAGSFIHHVHIATYATRKSPGIEPCDFSDFFLALHAIGYAGGISIEGAWTDLGREAEPALAVLRRGTADAAQPRKK